MPRHAPPALILLLLVGCSSPGVGAGTALNDGVAAQSGGTGNGGAPVQAVGEAGTTDSGMNVGSSAGGVAGTAAFGGSGVGGMPTGSVTLPTAGTGSAGATNSAGSPMEIPSTGGVTNTGGATGMAGTSGEDALRNEELFSGDNLPRFDLEISDESWAALAEISSSEDARLEYVPATLRYQDLVLENVGLRLKGEGSFRQITEKAAWKLKLDEFVPDQTLLGQKRLTLNNMVEDPSFLAERLAYHVFRAADLPAPRCNSAQVYVNGEYYGVYANIEAEDKPFLRRWFDDDGGNLYEEGQVDFLPGNADAFDLETNMEANDRSDLVALIDAIAAVGAGSPWASLDSVLDTEHFLRFTAAEAAVDQWDMYAYTRFWPNNFRLYAAPTTSRFTFLPWGMDLSMKPFRDSGKPHVELFEISRQGDHPQGDVVAGLIFRQCLDDADCRSRLAAAGRELADLYESLELESLADTYHEQIREAVESDTLREYTPEQFEDAHRSLLETIRTRAETLRANAAE